MTSSSDFISAACMADSPENTVRNDDSASRVTLAAHAPGELDGAHRRKNGRQTHGVERLKHTLREAQRRGLPVLDRRTALGSAIAEWTAALVDAKGGADAISPQVQEIVGNLKVHKLVLAQIDTYLLEVGGKIINRRKKSLIPIIQQRMQLADSMLRHLQAIGLERIARKTETLAEYSRRISAEHQSGGTSVP